jgi:hypothetical protein
MKKFLIKEVCKKTRITINISNVTFLSYRGTGELRNVLIRRAGSRRGSVWCFTNACQALQELNWM